MADFSGLFMFSFVRHLARCLVRGSSPQGHSLLGNSWRTERACLGSFVSISHRDIVAVDLLVDQDAGSAAQPIGTQLTKNLDFHRSVIDFDWDTFDRLHFQKRSQLSSARTFLRDHYN